MAARHPLVTDLDDILERIWNGKSLRAACIELGLHIPSTSDFLNHDPQRKERYDAAREGRAEHLQEEALTVARAAALRSKFGEPGQEKVVDPAGARTYLEAAKWAIARMAPKTTPATRLIHSFKGLSDEELHAEIARLCGGTYERPK